MYGYDSYMVCALVWLKYDHVLSFSEFDSIKCLVSSYMRYMFFEILFRNLTSTAMIWLCFGSDLK